MKSNISNLLKFTVTNLARSFLKSMSSFQSMFLIRGSAILDLTSAWTLQCTLVYDTHRPPTFFIFWVLCSAYRPLVRGNLVCHFEDKMTRDRSPRVQVVWVLVVVFKLFRRPLFPARCSHSVFPVLGKF